MKTFNLIAAVASATVVAAAVFDLGIPDEAVAGWTRILVVWVLAALACVLTFTVLRDGLSRLPTLKPSRKRLAGGDGAQAQPTGRPGR